MARRANNRTKVPFAYKLVLNQWLLSLFNVKLFEECWPNTYAMRRWKGWTRTTSIASTTRSWRTTST